MAAQLFLLPFRPAIGPDSLIIVGAKINFYLTGTLNRAPVYTSSTLTTPLPNPVVANAAGVWPDIYFDTSVTYRVTLTDASGIVLKDTDPYFPSVIDGLSSDVLAAVATVSAAASSAITAKNQAQALVDPLNAIVNNYGYRYNYVTTPVTFTDDAVNINRTTYVETSPLARCVLSTDATKVKIHGYCTLKADFPQFSELGVIVNGTYLQSITVPANGPFTTELTLATGAKTVEIVNGSKSKPNGTQIGTYFVSIEANSPAPQIVPTYTNRVVFVVDSIGSGANATIPTKESYISRLRAVTSDSLVAFGYGYNTLSETAGTQTLRDAFVAKLVSLGANKIVITLGTNDYGLATSTATTFGNTYDLLLQAIHTALPSATIFAVTPIVRTTEGTNGQGNTLAQYRTAISTAASGKSWVTVVDGTTFMTTASLDDGIHPTSLGHLKWAQGIDSYLGYNIPDAPAGTAPLNANDAYSTITTPSSGVTRATKTAGGAGFNCGVYAPIRTGDFRYQIDAGPTTGGSGAGQDTMIGLNAAPQNDSGFGDMLHQIYLEGSGNVRDYTGSTSGANLGTYNPGFPNARFWVNRTGSTVTFRQGAASDNTYANSSLLLTVTGVSGSIALDFSMFTVGSYVDVTMVS